MPPETKGFSPSWRHLRGRRVARARSGELRVRGVFPMESAPRGRGAARGGARRAARARRAGSAAQGGWRIAHLSA